MEDNQNIGVEMYKNNNGIRRFKYKEVGERSDYEGGVVNIKDF